MMWMSESDCREASHGVINQAKLNIRLGQANKAYMSATARKGGAVMRCSIFHWPATPEFLSLACRVAAWPTRQDFTLSTYVS